MDDARALPMPGKERGLVEAAAAGDAAAFDALVRQHSARIFRLAYAMLRSREDAEDVQQETFIRAFRKLRSFRGDASVRTWLCAIAARICLARKRRVGRTDTANCSLSSDLPSSADDPQQRLAQHETAARVQRALGALAAPDRLLIVLKCIEGLTHDEIAHILHCSPASSRSRLSRAKRLFREQYERLE